MIKDRIICNWCGYDGVVDLGADKCPNCKKEGFLMWKDPDNPEIEV